MNEFYTHIHESLKVHVITDARIGRTVDCHIDTTT